MTKQEALNRLNRQMALRKKCAAKTYQDIAAIEQDASDARILVMQSFLMEDRAAANALEYAIWIVECMDGG